MADKKNKINLENNILIVSINVAAGRKGEGELNPHNIYLFAFYAFWPITSALVTVVIQAKQASKNDVNGLQDWG